ncbi:unnamed protein product, partial [Allacma fusca]
FKPPTDQCFILYSIHDFWLAVFKDDEAGWTWEEVANQPLHTIIIPSIGKDDLSIYSTSSIRSPKIPTPPGLSAGFDQVLRLAFNKLRNSETDFESPAVVIDLNSFGFDSRRHIPNSEFKDIRQYNWKSFSIRGKDVDDPELVLYYDTGARNQAEETNVFSIDDDIINPNRKDFDLKLGRKKIGDLETILHAWRKGSKTSAPVHAAINSPFHDPGYIPEFNPDYLKNPIKYMGGHGKLGVTTPCVVTLGAQMVSPFGFNEQKLGELDIVTNNDDIRHADWIQKIVVVVPQSAVDVLNQSWILDRINQFEEEYLGAENTGPCENYLD